MTLNIEEEVVTAFDFDYKQVIEDVINAALDFEECPYETEVNVIITNNDEIALINKDYRDIAAPTDVLSFPMIDYTIPGDFSILEECNQEDYFHPDTGELMLGDIILSYDKILEQAQAYNHTVKRELAFLVAHSMLHLFGYDHMEPHEQEVMEEKQKDILEMLKITR